MTTPMTEYRRHFHGIEPKDCIMNGPNAVSGFENAWEQMTDPEIITTVPSTVRFYINKIIYNLGMLADPNKLCRLDYAQSYLDPALQGQERLSIPFQIAELAVRWNETFAGKLAQIKLLQRNPKPGYNELFSKLGMQPVIDEIANLRKLNPYYQPTNGDGSESNDKLSALSRRFHPYLFSRLSECAGQTGQCEVLPSSNCEVIKGRVYDFA